MYGQVKLVIYLPFLHTTSFLVQIVESSTIANVIQDNHLLTSINFSNCLPSNKVAKYLHVCLQLESSLLVFVIA